jgi:chromate transporter
VTGRLPALIAVFAYLSLLTVGGGMAAFPELKTLTVDVHHWLTFEQLIHLYSVGQLAPGPNMMLVAAVGERVAGPLGALAAVVAFFLPTGLFTFGIGRLWERLAGWPWLESIQNGLAPVSIGLLFAGAIVIAEGAVTDAAGIAIAGSVFALLLLTRINPALLILASAGIGVAMYLYGLAPKPA